MSFDESRQNEFVQLTYDRRYIDAIGNLAGVKEI